jgi:hypothetical protein
VQGGTQKGGSHPARSVPNENKIAMYEAPDSTATDDSPRSDRLDKLDRVVTDHGYGPPANRLWRGRTTVRLTYESGLHLLVEPRTVSIEAVWTGTDEELPAKLAVGLPHVIPSRIGANGCPKCQYYHVSDTVKWCTWTNPPLNLMRNDATCLKRRKN